MNELECTDMYIFDFPEKEEETEYVKACSTKTKKTDLKQLIDKVTEFSTRKLDSTVEEVKRLLGL